MDVSAKREIREVRVRIIGMHYTCVIPTGKKNFIKEEINTAKNNPVF